MWLYSFPMMVIREVGIDGGDDSHNVNSKINLRFFKLSCVYSNSPKKSNISLEVNCWEPHSILERDWKKNSSSCVWGNFTSCSNKVNLRSVLHVQNCCFAYQTCCFFDVLLVVAVVVAKAPYWNLAFRAKIKKVWT